MFKMMRNELRISLFMVFMGLSCCFGEAIDPERYITIDEIKPGMKAYCLTCYKGTKIERFKLEVLSVVRGINPGQNAIMVQGVGERFIHTGPVAGCSGSPVFIEGRLAGALAFGWTFSKDPLYGVTPIEEMLAVGKEGSCNSENFISFDFSRPIDLENISEQIKSQSMSSGNAPVGANVLLCPVVTSGLSVSACKMLDSELRPLGMMAVAGGGSKADKGKRKARKIVDEQEVKLEPGSTLAVPLVTGDIEMTAIGTVTEVVGDKVYGFGHSFLGYGPVEFPMATGKIHTVVSSVSRSFKLGSSLDIVGALTHDESSAIKGVIGAKANMIPLKVTVSRYNDPKIRTYNSEVADNQLLTPRLIASAILGSALMLGELPPDNTIRYKVCLKGEEFDDIVFENLSGSAGLNEVALEVLDISSVLMNNAYKRVKLSSVEVEVDISNKSSIAHIWSARISDDKVEAGDKVKVDVVVESVLAGKKNYSYDLEIPEDTKPGTYKLMLCGERDYLKFMMKTTPYRFRAQSFESLVKAFRNLLQIKRDQLYCVLMMDVSGVSIEQAELADLPGTKTMVLLDPKRTLKAYPYMHWLEKKFETGTQIIDQKVLAIEVEK